VFGGTLQWFCSADDEHPSVHEMVTGRKRVLHGSLCRRTNPVAMNEHSRADMHVHSTASQLSKLGIQRSLHLPECSTPPDEVYDLAKRRGMDFVTITDHDTIAGALAIADHDDTFISVELTVSFKREPQAVHVLCFGITPDDHEWLQAHNDDVETCAAYLSEHEITAALAHPFFAVGAPLTPRHRRRLAQLFPIWETRNGSRAKELNLPAFVYIETHGGTAIGGSDDHAGIDVGRTFTETPRAANPAEFLAHVRAGRAGAHGAQGSAAKWTHAAMALAIRSLGRGDGAERPVPSAVLKIIERVMREGDVRSGQVAADLGPEDARALLRSWLAAMELGFDEQRLLRSLQDGDLGHPDLYRRARRIHERKLAQAVQESVSALGSGTVDLPRIQNALFDACVPAIPYAAASAFLGREKLKLTRNDGDRPRVALIADGLGSMHGVTHTIQQIRDRGVPGYDVEVIGTDADVDRRLSAVSEIEVPFYRGMKIGVPTVPALAEALAEGRYDIVHLCSPGPAGIGAWLSARVLELPMIGSYHTELAAYAGLRTGLADFEAIANVALHYFYGVCDVVLSPSPATDDRLRQLGIAEERIGRWDRGVDIERFDPALRTPGLLPSDSINVLYVGRLTKEKGVELLADAFLAARRREQRLHLVLAGGGPEEEALRSRLGEQATFLGWLEGQDLARAYASADAFMFASRTDTFGQVILEAQASGLPVIAVDQGGPASLIVDGETGLLAPGEPGPLAKSLLEVVQSPLVAERLRKTALAVVRGRTWEASLEQLAAGYRSTLLRSPTPGTARNVA
jgi:glycosyltransferase involved in cell wall biosynthesis/predicted metal-dependent phosphoesterase TrpH